MDVQRLHRKNGRSEGLGIGFWRAAGSGPITQSPSALPPFVCNPNHAHGESRQPLRERVRCVGMPLEKWKLEDATHEVIGALIEVHRHLGPGLMESAYEACVCAELSERGIRFEQQRPLPVRYKNAHVDCAYRLDLVVEDGILVELKAVERLLPIHEAQVITYLRLSRLPVGLLVNFNAAVLRNGLRRLTPEYSKPFRPSALPVQSKRKDV